MLYKKVDQHRPWSLLVYVGLCWSMLVSWSTLLCPSITAMLAGGERRVARELAACHLRFPTLFTKHRQIESVHCQRRYPTGDVAPRVFGAQDRKWLRDGA